MADKPLSAAMAICMAEAIEHGGKLVRHTGNNWCWPGWRPDDGECFRTGTVEGLVARGEMRFIKWRRGPGGRRIPVAVAVVGKFGREAA